MLVLLVDLGEDVADVVPGVPVQTLLQPLLVQVVTNETNASSEDKHPVERSGLDVRLGLVFGEAATVSKKIDKADRDAAVHVQDQVRFLTCGDTLRLKSIVQHSCLGEVVLGKLLHQGHALVRVVDGLNPVANAHDEFSFLSG